MSSSGRPRFHIRPDHGWLNDPNGLIEVDGRYHVFYQHNPAEAVWGNIHWGHASSTDLVHWRREPIAMAPTPDGPDEDGCWSGCAIMGPDGPVVLYTGRRGDSESVCIAHGDTSLRRWHKDPANPVLEPPPGMQLTDFRDPRVWQEGNDWRMVVGAGLATGAGAVLLFRSPDLRLWELAGPLLVGRKSQPGGGVELGEVWECPDLFSLDGRDVLLYSITPGREATRYVTGSREARGFSVQRDGLIDLGPYFYAAQTLVDPSGRRIVLGWVREGRSVEAQRAAGWSGMLSLPREMALDPDGRVLVRPIPELAALRLSGIRIRELRMASEETYVISPDIGTAWEARLRFRPQPGARLRLALGLSVDGAESTLVECDAGAGTLTLDRTRSSLDADTDRDVQVMRVWPVPPAEIKLHVFMDGTVIELFIDGMSLTTRVYPTRGGSGVSLTALGGGIGPVSLELWPLASAEAPA